MKKWSSSDLLDLRHGVGYEPGYMTNRERAADHIEALQNGIEELRSICMNWNPFSLVIKEINNIFWSVDEEDDGWPCNGNDNW